MSKYFYLISITYLVSFYAIAQEEVYRWVDENGNVHYADQPKDANAKRFILRNNNYAAPPVTDEQLQQNNKALAAIKPSSDYDARVATGAESSDKDTYPENSCDYLRDQIAQAQTQLNSNDQVQVRQARIFLEAADKMLNDGKCN